MTEDGFIQMVEYIQGVYQVDFTDGTKDAWWVSFQKIPDAIAQQASKNVAARADIRKPHLGAILETCNAITLEREGRAWALPADASKGLKGVPGRITRESLVSKAWRPTTEVEREGAFLFRELLHQAHGLFDQAKMQAACRPRLDLAGAAGLRAVDGFESLNNLGLHDVLMAREEFVKAFAQARASKQGTA